MRTFILLAAITALFLGIGYMLGGVQGAVIAFAVTFAMNLFAFWSSDSMPLKMHGAREIAPESASKLYGLVQNLAAAADLPMPRLYLIESPQPNAFATGRSPEKSAVAVTTGIMQALSSEELSGVIAHELAHIKHRDTLLMTITATLAGAISMIGNFAFFMGGNNRNNPFGIVGVIAAMVVAPLAAGLIQMAISRTREYEADRMGAEICGNPLWLASALHGIQRAANSGIQMETAERSPATAHMFIINPLIKGGLDNLFSTHPKTEKRVAALQQQAERMGINGFEDRIEIDKPVALNTKTPKNLFPPS